MASDEPVFTQGLMEYIGCTTGERVYAIKPDGKSRSETSGRHPAWIEYYDFNCIDDDVLFKHEPSLTMSEFNEQWEKIDGPKLFNETLRKLNNSDKSSGYVDYLEERLNTFAKQGLLNELLFVSASSDKILENLRSYQTLDSKLALDYLALSEDYSDPTNIFLAELLLKQNFLETTRFGFTEAQLNILGYARPITVEFFAFQYAKSKRISEIKESEINKFKEQVRLTPRHSFVCPNFLKYAQKRSNGGRVRWVNLNAMGPGPYDEAFQAVPECVKVYEEKLAYLNLHMEKLRLELEDKRTGKKIIANEVIK